MLMRMWTKRLISPLPGLEIKNVMNGMRYQAFNTQTGYISLV